MQSVIEATCEACSLSLKPLFPVISGNHSTAYVWIKTSQGKPYMGNVCICPWYLQTAVMKKKNEVPFCISLNSSSSVQRHCRHLHQPLGGSRTALFPLHCDCSGERRGRWGAAAELIKPNTWRRKLKDVNIGEVQRNTLDSHPTSTCWNPSPYFRLVYEAAFPWSFPNSPPGGGSGTPKPLNPWEPC